jgi:hypothetical protein
MAAAFLSYRSTSFLQSPVAVEVSLLIMDNCMASYPTAIVQG